MILLGIIILHLQIKIRRILWDFIFFLTAIFNCRFLRSSLEIKSILITKNKCFNEHYVLNGERLERYKRECGYIGWHDVNRDKEWELILISIDYV